jgi:hypothetical protein
MFARACVAVLCLATLAAAQAPNTLTDEEKAAGWKLLFDGKTTAGWRSLGTTTFPAKGWVVEDGALKHVAKAGGGDIATADAYENFEFTFEWKVAPGANSGVKYRVQDKKGGAFGPEYQVIDDQRHADAKNEKRRAASLYDVFTPQGAKPNAVGEWNQSKIVVQGNRFEHWLNGVKVVETEWGSEAWKAAVEKSKFKPQAATFAAGPRGHIAIQDHGDEVAYRNLKIRALPAK